MSFSAVSTAQIPRDVLNYIAHAHLIPVVDGGVSVETDEARDSLFSAHWRAHMVTPYHRCLRCYGQYSSSDVVMELDGSLDDPSYVSNLPSSERRRNQNVFPFSLSVAGMEVNLLIRYILSSGWWPVVRQQDYQFVTAEMRVHNDECHSQLYVPRPSSKGRLGGAILFEQTKSLYLLSQALAQVIQSCCQPSR